MDCWGFVQSLSGEAKQHQPGGPLVLQPFSSASHCEECQPLREAPGCSEGRSSVHCVLMKSRYCERGDRFCPGTLDLFIRPQAEAHLWQIVSAPLCLSGYELQQSTDGSSRLLAHLIPSVTHQGSAHEPDVDSESRYQFGHITAHSSVLPSFLFVFRGEMPAHLRSTVFRLDL